MSWPGLFRGSEWLLGVYKGGLVTASDEERGSIWEYTYKIRSKGVFRTADKRQKLIPYFFVLAPVPDGDTHIISGHSAAGAHEYLAKFGLDSLAYEDGGMEPIPAYGKLKNGGFALDTKLVERYEKKNGISLEERVKGCVCALALKMELGIVRTGTFFRPSAEDGRIVFTPLTDGSGSGTKYVVGKGILLGMAKDYPKAGGMYQGEYENEMRCPVTRLCVGFKHRQGSFYIVYRKCPRICGLTCRLRC